MRRVSIQMSDKHHRVLKTYAAMRSVTMADLVHELIDEHIRKEAQVNNQVKNLLDFHGLNSDLPV